MNKIALALGGNSGFETGYFHKAAALLEKGGVSNIRISSLYTNPAVGCIPGTPDFTNAAITGETCLKPDELLKLCRKIESDLGRPSEHRSDMSRTIDIDIILFGSITISMDGLTIPHPRAAGRDFVLMPLAEIAGEWVFPGLKGTVKECLENLKRQNKVRPDLIKAQ